MRPREPAPRLRSREGGRCSDAAAKERKITSTPASTQQKFTNQLHVNTDTTCVMSTLNEHTANIRQDVTSPITSIQTACNCLSVRTDGCQAD